jgi:hypothetical protein
MLAGTSEPFVPLYQTETLPFEPLHLISAQAQDHRMKLEVRGKVRFLGFFRASYYSYRPQIVIMREMI